MIDKVFSVYDLHDENVLLQKATIKAEIAVLTEEKSKLETNLQETKNVVAVEMQALQRELESIQGEIQTNNSAIADLEDEKTRLTTEIEPLRYEKGNLLSEINVLKEQVINTKTAHEAEMGTLKYQIQQQIDIKEKAEIEYQKIIATLSKEVGSVIEKKAKLDVYIDELKKYEKVSNARFIQEVQKLLDKQGIKLDVFKEVQKHIK